MSLSLSRIGILVSLNPINESAVATTFPATVFNPSAPERTSSPTRETCWVPFARKIQPATTIQKFIKMIKDRKYAFFFGLSNIRLLSSRNGWPAKIPAPGPQQHLSITTALINMMYVTSKNAAMKIDPIT
mmetsp:Transcript_21623/g.26545  ORF Transcript_21623/g.26545 Transcript_21623/m.26545 type:complete len:130 (-) Transcript_21623:488-877(-)